MIPVTPTIALDEADIEEQFIRASGPGGQNVNKVETSVQLRFNTQGLSGLDEGVRHRLTALAGRRLNRDGVIVITADRFRTRERNRADALERLIDLIRQASVRPKTRRKTRPSKSARTKRTDSKTQRGQLKRTRGSYSSDD